MRMSSMSPGATALAGLMRASLSSTLPHSIAAVASERVLKKRAAHSHLSMRNLSLSSLLSMVMRVRRVLHTPDQQGGAVQVVHLYRLLRCLIRHGEGAADEYRSGAHFGARLAPQPFHRHRREVGEHHVVLRQIASLQTAIPDAAPVHLAVAVAAQPDAQPAPQKRQRGGFHARSEEHTSEL